MSLSRNTKRAIESYGRAVCVQALHENEVVGNGARTIGYQFGLTTNQADAAINAGREISESEALSSTDPSHSHLTLRDFGCVIWFSGWEARHRIAGNLRSAPIHADGSFDIPNEGTEVSAPQSQAFLDAINRYYGSELKLNQFAGR